MDAHCELAHYAAGASTWTKMTIVIEYKPATKSFVFVKSRNPILHALYKNDGAFFAQAHKTIKAIFHTYRPHNRPSSANVVHMSAWVLEMMCKERGLRGRSSQLAMIERLNLSALQKRGLDCYTDETVRFLRREFKKVFGRDPETTVATE